MRQIQSVIEESMFDPSLGIDIEELKRSNAYKFAEQLESMRPPRKLVYTTDCIGNELKVGDLVFGEGEFGVVTNISKRSSITMYSPGKGRMAVNGRSTLLIKNVEEYLK